MVSNNSSSSPIRGRVDIVKAHDSLAICHFVVCCLLSINSAFSGQVLAVTNDNNLCGGHALNRFCARSQLLVSLLVCQWSLKQSKTQLGLSCSKFYVHFSSILNLNLMLSSYINSCHELKSCSCNTNKPLAGNPSCIPGFRSNQVQPIRSLILAILPVTLGVTSTLAPECKSPTSVRKSSCLGIWTI